MLPHLELKQFLHHIPVLGIFVAIALPDLNLCTVLDLAAWDVEAKFALIRSDAIQSSQLLELHDTG